MRKLAARLGDGCATEQVTTAQKAMFGSFVANAVMMVWCPDAIFFQVLEIVILASFVLGGWWHFLRFVFTSKDAFRAVSVHVSGKFSPPPASVKRLTGTSPTSVSLTSSPPPRLETVGPSAKSNLQAIKRVNSAKKNLAMNMAFCHFIIHFMFLLGVLLSQLWPANETAVCHVRDYDDARYTVESVRFYLCDVFHVTVFVLVWQTIFIFTANKKRKAKAAAAKGKGAGNGTNKGSYENGSKSKSFSQISSEPRLPLSNNTSKSGGSLGSADSGSLGSESYTSGNSGREPEADLGAPLHDGLRIYCTSTHSGNSGREPEADLRVPLHDGVRRLCTSTRLNASYNVAAAPS